jgi:triosephosphate isomerase
VRKPIVAANWKMNKTVGEGIDLAAEVKRRLAELEGREGVICPPFTSLKPVGDLLRYSKVKLGAQNMHWIESGAYTGEISAAMLRDLGCDYVILGHSERRTHFGETDEQVNLKAKAALEAGLRPIVCVGETIEQREAGQAEEVVRTQLLGSLSGLRDELAGTVIAYEPVWAIGTGRTATPDQAQAAHAFIRRQIGEVAGDEIADGIRIQYGGSVKPGNAAELFALPDVDGGLIGGASLDADSFVQIVNAA